MFGVQVLISNVRAVSVTTEIPVSPFAPDRKATVTACLVRIEADNGMFGEGLTTLEASVENSGLVSRTINQALAPLLLGSPVFEIERLAEQMFWKLSPRGQGGMAFHIISAVDTALWDLAAKSAGLPLWRMLGGARKSVPVYATFGFADLDREELADAALRTVEAGFSKLKMVVGSTALRDRARNGGLAAVVAEDAKRIKRVREAIGEDVELFIDANCSLDPYHALRLARACSDANLAWFEEPVSHNDVRALRDLRSKINMPIAVGQNESLLYRFNDLLGGDAVDVVQPNVVRSGGVSGVRKIAAVSEAHGRHISNGGGWHLHNLPVLAGMANGHMAEFHHGVAAVYDLLYEGVTQPKDGILHVTDEPGLGFSLDWDRVDEYITHG